jgi:hypothetical protein
MSEVRSFTTAQARKRAEAEAAGGQLRYIEFDIDGEKFYAAPIAPGGALLDAAAAGQAKNNVERLRVVAGFLDAVLTSESAERFSQRMRTGDNPIDLATAAQVMAFLMEEYGGRPTVPSSASSDGLSGTDGAPSTSGVSPVESTPSPSPLTG